MEETDLTRNRGQVEQWVSEESMAGEYAADCGDARRKRRAQRIGVAISKKPELSFPKVFQEQADLEAFYRLVGNDSVTWRSLSEAHTNAVVARASGAPEVLVVHDTTDVSFRTYWPDQLRTGLAKVTNRTHGCFLHASFAVTSLGPALPLGMLALQPFVHKVGLFPDDFQTQSFWLEEGGLFDNEHERWFRAIDDAEQRLRSVDVRAIHVMDRETDSYGLLSWMVSEGLDFVVRCDSHRRLLPHGEPLRQVGQVEVVLGERFPLRNGHSKDTHPARRSRKALLTLKAGEVTLSRSGTSSNASWSPGGWATQPKTLTLHLVEAIEENPPEGEKGVRWLLLTREPIKTSEQVLHVVDLYRRRWLIEEFFKALKTGCRLEERQMESAETLLRVVSLLVPAAWRLLLLRSLSTEAPEALWKSVLTPLEFRLLQKAVPKARLTVKATVNQCLYAIAKLGGHLPNNGRPGWQTLHAGWRVLQDYVQGVLLFQADVIND